MEYPPMDYINCGEQAGGAGAFICTECGEGFDHYPDLLTHMPEHGPVEPFPYDCQSNGFGAPLEFALHENGMLTVVDRSAEYNYTSNGKSSSQVLPWNPATHLASQASPMILASTQATRLESQPTSVVQTPLHPLPLESQSTPVILASTQALLQESQPTPVIQAPSHASALDSKPTPVILSPTKAAESENSSNTLVPPHPARFRCEMCNQVFNTRLGLLRHQRYRTLERGYKCTLCCRVFGEREDLRQHLQYHAHERFYSCKQCGKRFLKQESLRTHQDERHGTAGCKTLRKLGEGQESSLEKSYPCKMCDLRFFWLSDLQSHLLSHANGKIVSSVPAYTSPPTQKSPSKNEVLLDNHIQSKQDTPVFKKKTSPDSPVPSANVSFRPYRCGLCGNRFQQLSDLKKHHLTHQTQDDRVNVEPEPVPKQQFRSVPAARQQIQSGAATRQHIHPGVAGKQTKTRGRPPRGSQSNHNARVYPCKLCHRVFVHSSSLSRHMRYHKGTLHTCVFCGRHFPQRCDVRRHIAMYHHSEVLPTKPETAEGAKVEDHNSQGAQITFELEKGSPDKRMDSLYPCAKCGKEYLSKYELDGHSCASQQPIDPKEVSSSPKPRVTFQCNDCGKGFGLLCVYQRHQRYHRRELAGEVHKCPHCPRRFRQSSALLRHLDTHQNQSPGEDDNDVQVSSTTTYSQDATIALEHDDEDLEDDEDTDEEEGSGTASAEVLYECTECTETFSCLATFLQHQSAHGTESIG
ncbi:zinc finger protein 569 [Anguilla anguilla]|uniref:zinc finger protein 569 n=1 Tax=Anguilla anguilla TaxID=7936 RepID=UPI0015AA8871|nr:zinc finger protein 569 [Anguilla anguilla]